jgi:NAD(P)-dependent dehydrogenase (short-subunit alcohol dehydrogenase family)
MTVPQRILVTGGTRGIGAATADLLITSGARVLVTARTAADTGAIPLVVVDLATAAGARAVAAEVDRRLGGIDAVVHCVGSSFAKPGGALALDDDDWARALDTNLMSAVRLDRLLAPRMVAQGRGAIVHVSSLQWKRPHESSPAYGPAKAALTSYSKVLSAELAPRGVRVNTVTPGFIATSGAERRIATIMAASGVAREAAETELVASIGGVPLGRPGTAAEVAHVIAFVISNAASYLCGAELTVDGGNCRVL